MFCGFSLLMLPRVRCCCCDGSVLLLFIICKRVLFGIYVETSSNAVSHSNTWRFALYMQWTYSTSQNIIPAFYAFVCEFARSLLFFVSLNSILCKSTHLEGLCVKIWFYFIVVSFRVWNVCSQISFLCHSINILCMCTLKKKQQQQ